MLDQNTTTIVAAIIAVIGTLAGAIIGVVLSNRHTTKLEQLRIEQEKLKRNTAIIEEIYTTVNKVRSTCSQIYDSLFLPTDELQFMKLSMDAQDKLSSHLERIITLVDLYIPSLKRELQPFVHQTRQYRDRQHYYYLKKQNLTVLGPEITALNKERDQFEKSCNDFQNALAILVR